ncbi:MAG: type I restriction enzyme S subunit [Oleiphilaceae bacterium]|jgi:type I restriction enzyme S subunit
MGKYQAYEEYKDTGVEWLGQIPTSWELWKLTHAYDEIGSGTTPPSGSDELYGGDVPWITTGELREKEIFSTTKNVTRDALRKLSALRKFPRGSIAIAMYGATIGRLGILGVEATTNQACCVLTKSNVLNNKYLYYWLQAFKQDIVNLASGGGQPNINQEVVASLKISAPKKFEQQKIANFLDHETAKIDTLIEKQQQLIALLKEKRQAVISHAVTKGLNPDAPMRDSGVEWLGEVPEHWKIGRYKFCTSRVVVGIAEAATHAYAETGVPIIRSTNIREEGLDLSGMLFIKQGFAELNSSKYLYTNDIITVRTGYPGTSAVIPETLDKSQCFTNLVATPKEEMSPHFLSEYLNSHTGKSYFDLLGWGSAQKNISVPILQNISIAWPVISEQKEIVNYIQQQREQYTKLVTKGRKQIQLLQERRTALISAAVTGKIDVRNWVAPEENKNKDVA